MMMTYEVFEDPESQDWGFLILNENTILDGSVSCYGSEQMARADLAKKLVQYDDMAIERSVSWFMTA